MSIPVICPGCHRSFKVSDKFAGKSGACPKCKTTINVPEKGQEVVVHAPAEFAEGGRSASGKLITKPIARKEAKLEPVNTVAVAGAVLTVAGVTWAAGGLIQSSLAIRIVGLLLVSPPLVVAAYSFLRDDELEPHHGVELYIRSAVCAVVYAAMWGVYGYLAGAILTGELWEWLLVAPPLLATGGLVALACLDLDYGAGFFHYAFYVLVTVLLRWIAGMGWPWDLASIVVW
jgi:hypothetical protein